MKILILANFDAGLYKFRKELIQELVKEHQVSICVPKGEYTERLVELGCDFIPCELLDRRGKNPFKDLKLLLFYKAIIKTVKPEIVLTYTIKPNVYGGIACGLLGIPYIANITGLGTSIENGGLLSKLTLFLYKLGLNKAKCVFFQNKSNRELFIRKKIIKGRTKLIPGSGVNLIEHCYESYPINDDNINLLFIGRIMKDKGINELLEAYSEIYKENTNIALNIIGDYEESYKNIIEKYQIDSKLTYLGFKDNIHSYIKNSHCVILPSYHEGMSNVLLEAASTGRPIIATNISGCKEIFDEGITGFGCEPQNVDSLKEAIEKFLKLKLENKELMGRLAREKMEEAFDRDNIIKSYLFEIKRNGEFEYESI